MILFLVATVMILLTAELDETRFSVERVMIHFLVVMPLIP